MYSQKQCMWKKRMISGDENGAFDKNESRIELLKKTG